MGPERGLPYNDQFDNVDSYIDSLLNFFGTNDLLRLLCGGVHLLDFFTSDPDLYSRMLPKDWRDFFSEHEMMDILDLFMREDLDQFLSSTGEDMWRGGPFPPESLVDYVRDVRRHLLDREVKSTQCSRNRTQKKLAKRVSVGMNVKKVHEVGLFASYIDNLAEEVSSSMTGQQAISHLVDFGSGQSYLGRALASEPYNRNVVAIESKTQNRERAKFYDVKARLVEKEKFVRNKKAFRARLEPHDTIVEPKALPTPPSEPEGSVADDERMENGCIEVPEKGGGSIQHIELRIQSGDLSHVIPTIQTQQSPYLMVISLHSCGNLIHHGLRSLILNPAIKAVAMVGCCYNLMTERLGPATFKLPELRPSHPRVERLGNACDPDGFPMSTRFCNYGGLAPEDSGVRLNITARMMAVQAPANWGEKNSGSFFIRHFYRALLQRVFLDRGVVGPPSQDSAHGSEPASQSSTGTPILIGSLRKSCYDNFVAYVRGALAKLYEEPFWSELIKDKMGSMTDAEIATYEVAFKQRKKDVSVIWSLMAFSAGVVEAMIVVDRFLWLREQNQVKEVWVEPVFEYGVSPRNLVAVGVKK